MVPLSTCARPEPFVAVPGRRPSARVLPVTSVNGVPPDRAGDVALDIAGAVRAELGGALDGKADKAPGLVTLGDMARALGWEDSQSTAGGH